MAATQWAARAFLRTARRVESPCGLQCQRSYGGEFQGTRPAAAHICVHRRASCLAYQAHRSGAGVTAAAERVARIREALEREFAPKDLVITDDSAAHLGHAGAREGGHFRVMLVSDA